MQNLKSSNAKIVLIALFLFLGFSIVTARIAYIQLIGKESYVDKVVEKFP